MAYIRRIHFFATKNDLLIILSKLEASRPVEFTRCGRLDGPDPEIWSTGADLPNLGKAAGDQAVACYSFLIVAELASIVVEPTVMFDGDMRFDVEQSWNPDSVILHAGGEWVDGTLISGDFSTISNTPISQSLIKSARSAIKKHFTRVNAFWVGPEALLGFRSGQRLATAVQSPPEFNLRESPMVRQSQSGMEQ